MLRIALHAIWSATTILASSSLAFSPQYAVGQTLSPAGLETVDDIDSFLQIPDPERKFPLSTRNLTVEDALRLFSKNLRIGIEIQDDVDGQIVQEISTDLSREDFLETLALEFDFVWYFDGAVLRVSSVGDIETRVFPIIKHSGYAVVETLKSLQIYQPKFIHRYGERNRTLRVTGPSGYLDLIDQSVEAIDRVERTAIDVNRGALTRPLEDVGEGG